MSVLRKAAKASFASVRMWGGGSSAPLIAVQSRGIGSVALFGVAYAWRACGDCNLEGSIINHCNFASLQPHVLDYGT